MITHKIVKILLSSIISILCIGCISNTQKHSGYSTSSNENYLSVEYDHDLSWHISGDGSFELLVFNYNNSRLNERLSKKFDLTNSNEITLTFSLDENMNLSYYDNISNVTNVVQSETNFKKSDMDTSYTQTEQHKLLTGESMPLLLVCKNMTSIQSDFLLDYTSLTADYAVVIVIEKCP